MLSYGESSRNWVLNNGHVFPASFVEVDGESVVFSLEGGKKQRVPVANLGVADRYYIHTTHNIPVEELEGGNILTTERDYKAKSSEFETVNNLTLEGEGYKVDLGATITPHFAFFHDRGAKVKEYAEGLEKVIFSHNYRLPGAAQTERKQRRAFLFIKDFDLYEDLGKSMVDNLREEGKLSNRQINQLEVNWMQYAGRTGFKLPQDLVEKYNTGSHADIEFAKNKQDERRWQARRLIDRYWGSYPHKSRVRAGHSRSCKERVPADESKYRQSSSGFVYLFALGGSHTMRFWGGHDVGTGGGGEAGGYIPFGRYGDPKKFGGELASRVKSGKYTPSFEDFYRAPSNCAEITTGDELRQYWLPVAGLGCFFDHDLRHQFGTCRLLEFFQKNRRAPTTEEMPAIFEYESMEAMDNAFKDFLTTKITKMKY